MPMVCYPKSQLLKFRGLSMGMITNDYNIGFEVVNLCVKTLDHKEVQLNELIDKLARTNVEIEIIKDVMNKLSHAKQKDKKADFSDDEQMTRCITHIHRNNPTIFDDLIKGYPSHFPPKDPSSSTLSSEQITRDNVINENLENIDLGYIQIDPLTEDRIDVVVQGLDGLLKMHSGDLNENLLYINRNYDDRKDFTEAGRLIVKESGELLASINRKMGG